MIEQLKVHHARMQSSVPDSPVTANLAIHRLRSDATNSTVWQKQKLMTTECESWYVIGDALEHGEDSLRSSMYFSPSMRRVLDLQVVKDGSGK
eukprot:6920848-Pyramimonas_sp.AAC.1